MSQTLFKVLRRAWIALAVLVLAVTLFFFDGKPNSDADTLLAYGMLVLSFPISIAVALAIGFLGWAAYSLAGLVVPVTYVTIVVGWAIVFAAGYWQWFVALPLLLRALRERSRPSAQKAD